MTNNANRSIGAAAGNTAFPCLLLLPVHLESSPRGMCRYSDPGIDETSTLSHLFTLFMYWLLKEYSVRFLTCL